MAYEYEWYSPDELLASGDYGTEYANKDAGFNDWFLNLNYKDELSKYKNSLIKKFNLSDEQWDELINTDFSGSRADSAAFANYLWSINKANERHRLKSGLQDGSISARDYQQQTSNFGISLSPEETQSVNNMISAQSAAEQNAENRNLRDTSITSAANQYAQLGLNPASVISTGGVNAGSAAMAGVDESNPAMQRKQLAQEKFNQMASTARTLLGVTGSMASAGIYGGSIYAAKKAASRAAAAMAHSAESTIKYNFGAHGEPLGHQVIDRQWK